MQYFLVFKFIMEIINNISAVNVSLQEDASTGNKVQIERS